MNHRIEGWCIIDSRDGSRWGGLYESEAGAKSSYWNWAKWGFGEDPLAGKKFNEQSVYILQALVLLEYPQ